MNKEEGQKQMAEGTSTSSSTDSPIHSSNIGFKLLKKHGWKEGTGLGVSEQGRLQPIQAHLKTNKKGLGTEKIKKKSEHSRKPDESVGGGKTDQVSSGKKAKAISKRMKKMQEFEKCMQEKEFEQAYSSESSGPRTFDGNFCLT